MPAMSLSPTFGSSVPGPVPRAHHPGLGGIIAGFIMDKIVLPLEVAAARRALRTELSHLDHRELRDLGINEAGLDGFIATWRPIHRS